MKQDCFSTSSILYDISFLCYREPAVCDLKEFQLAGLLTVRVFQVPRLEVVVKLHAFLISALH